MIKHNVRIYRTGVFDVWKNNAFRRIFRIYFLGWYECWKWKLVISIENFELWHKTWQQRVYYFLINKNWRKSRKWWNELVLIIYKKKNICCLWEEKHVFLKRVFASWGERWGKKLNIETILSGSFLVFEIFKDIRVFETMFACFLTLMKKVRRCKFNFMEQYGNTWYRIRSRLWSIRISSTYRTYNVTWTNIFIRSTHATHAKR